MKVLFCTPYGDITRDNIGGISVWAKAIVAQHRSVASDSDIKLEIDSPEDKRLIKNLIQDN